MMTPVRAMMVTASIFFVLVMGRRGTIVVITSMASLVVLPIIIVATLLVLMSSMAFLTPLIPVFSLIPILSLIPVLSLIFVVFVLVLPIVWLLHRILASSLSLLRVWSWSWPGIFPFFGNRRVRVCSFLWRLGLLVTAIIIVDALRSQWRRLFVLGVGRRAPLFLSFGIVLRSRHRLLVPAGLLFGRWILGFDRLSLMLFFPG